MIPPREPIRVVICDDLEEARFLAAYYMEADPQIELVGSAASLDELFEVLRTNKVDVVLLDFRLARGHPGEALDMLRSVEPDLPIILWTGYDRDGIPPAQIAKATGFLDKTLDADALIEAVRYASTHGHERLGGDE